MGLMQHRSRILLGATALLALGACSSIKDHRGFIVDPVLSDSIQPGIDNAQSVERTLGRPTFVSEFGRKDWYYVAINTQQKAFGRPQTKDQMVMRVTFDAKGNVATVDRSGVSKVVRLSPDGAKTPTLGRERSFLEDLFGNIGTVGTGMGGGGQGSNTGGPNGS
ncbi:MAG: outer membrane protein assembly factor BamE [Sphingomonadales bacterium]|nr:outer membrane protein assembly factor BamE [Sphingomonadales bacterium]